MLICATGVSIVSLKVTAPVNAVDPSIIAATLSCTVLIDVTFVATLFCTVLIAAAFVATLS